MNNMASFFSRIFTGPDGKPRMNLRDRTGVNPLQAQSTIGQTSAVIEILMRKAQVPQKYRSQLAPYIEKHLLVGRALPPNQKNTDEILINSLAGHTCVRTWVRKAFEDYENSVAKYTPDEIAAGREKLALEGTLDGMGLILGQGFNYVQEPPGKTNFFERDSSGKIIGILNMDKAKNQRFKECDAALRSGEELLPTPAKEPTTPETTASSVTASPEATPVATTYAGKRRRRQTKKKIQKKRKTLRRSH